MLMAKWKIKAFLTDEKGDVNIVSMVVLIGMAVILSRNIMMIRHTGNTIVASTTSAPLSFFLLFFI